jgi:hypothetical protein
MLDELIKLAEELYKKDKEMGKRMGDLLIELHVKLVEQHKMMAMMNKDLHDMLAHIEKLEGKKVVQ